MKYVKFTLVKLIVRTICVYGLVLSSYSQVYSVSKETKVISTVLANKANTTFFEDSSSSKKSLDKSYPSQLKNDKDAATDSGDSKSVLKNAASPDQATQTGVTEDRKEEIQTVLPVVAEPSKTDSSENKSNNISSVRKSKKRPKDVGGYFLSLVMSEKEIRDLKNDFIAFGEYYVSEFFQRFYVNFVGFIFTHPFIMLLLTAIIFFIMNIIFVMIILNFTISEKNRKSRYLKIYSQMYEGALLAYIFGEKDWSTVKIQLKHIKRKENKKILVTILFNLQENLKGNVSKYIPEIYVNLDLQKDALKASKSFIFHRKVQAIKELTYLYPEGAVKIIPALINDVDDKIRGEVQTSYIRLNQDHPFEFFKFLTNPFARWTQLSAFNLIRLHQLPVPSFVGFLNSNQFTVRNFCLRMINHFQQLENVSAIFKLLDSEIEKTRYLTYKVINDLRLYDGKLNIKKKYRNESDKNKMEIIKALRNIGSSEDIDFMEIIVKSESISLKTEACRSMYYLNEESKSRLYRLAQEVDPSLELFIAHITDQRN